MKNEGVDLSGNPVAKIDNNVFSLFFDLSLDVLCISDNKYILKANPAMIKLVGYTEEELLSSPFLLLIHPDDNDQTAQKVSDVNNGEKLFSYEFRLRKKNGEYCWMSWSSIRDLQNGILYSVGKDITQRKKMEDELRIAKRLLDLMDDAVIILSDDKVVYHNQALKKLTGYDKEILNEFENQSFIDYCTEARDIKAALNKQKNWRGEIHIKNPGGIRKDLDIYAGLIDIPTEQSDLTFAVIYDNEDRKLYEEKLKKQNEELNLVLESISDGFFVINRNLIVQYWNRKAEEILGKSREEVLGRNLLDCFPEEIVRAFHVKYKKVFKSKKSLHVEEYIEVLDRWFDVTLYPSIEQLSFYFKDITYKKKKETELKEINERYKLLIKASAGAIWNYDFATDMTYWYDNEFNSIFEYDSESRLMQGGIWDSNLIHPNDRKKFKTSIEDVLLGKKFWNTEFRLIREDGTYMYVSGKGCIMQSGNDTPVYMIGCLQDISAERIAEKEVLESQEDYKQLFNSAPLPQFIYDQNTLKFIKVNDAAVREYGFTKDEFLEMTIFDIRPEEELGKFLYYIKQWRKGENSANSIWVHQKKNKELMTVEVSATKIFYEKKPAVLATINNITEKISMEEKVLKLKTSRQKKIIEASVSAQEKERTEIAKELHDNINQILTTTNMYLELAQENESLRMEMIDRSRNNLTQSIQEIRALSKSLVTPTLEDIGLIDAIEELVRSYEITNKFQVHLNCDEFVINLDKGLNITLFRILQEQMNNINKHAFAKNVRIGLGLNNDEVCLTIKDDGKGFDTKLHSNGIGLCNIKNRVELHNGKMQIISQPSMGCLLEVRIPNSPEDQPVLNIMIAEDDEDDREMLAKAFAEVGPYHKISFVNDGNKLLRILKSMPENNLPSLIILDYEMPLLNGLEVLQELELNKRTRKIPKVIYSTSMDSASQQQCYSYNASAFIEKGTSMLEVKEHVKQMLAFCC